MKEIGGRPYSDVRKDTFRQASLGGEKPGKHLRELEAEPGLRVFAGHDRTTYAERVEALQGPEARAAFEQVCALAEAVKERGGLALLVGGSVRDEVLGLPSKDFDIEIYGLPPETIAEIAAGFGKVNEVGKAFGILKLMTESGIDLDLSLPRTDSKVGEGHQGFQIEVDPDMSVREAARRRDFTFNALAKDPLTGRIFDAFDGVKDLQARTLRVTDPELFRDDPLRVLRGAQFVGRFGLRVENDTLELMRDMVPEMAALAKERIREEWEKLLLKSARPSMGLQMLFDASVIQAYYPELAALDATPQEFEWHPEGDVWVHTLMVTDAGADVVREQRLEKEHARIVMYGALCHDLGKPATTAWEGDRLRSKGHEPAGDAPTRTFLEKFGVTQEDIDAVVAIVREHLWPSVTYFKHLKGEEISDGAFRKLALRLKPANIDLLTYVAEADHRGRGPFLDPTHAEQFLLPNPYDAGAWVRARAETLGIGQEAPAPILQGRDLIGLGFKPGKEFGRIIKLADRLRDERAMDRIAILEHLHAAAPDAEKAAAQFESLLASGA